MGRCCGGKNAGIPISWPRYMLGLSVFLGYHGTVQAALTLAALPLRRLRHVRDFHRQLMMQDLREILDRRDMNVGAAGRAAWAETLAEDDGACEVPAANNDAELRSAS